MTNWPSASRSGARCRSTERYAATSAALATEIARALDDAIAPLQQIQDEEMELRVREARLMGQRSVANRRDTEPVQAEQRRFRIDELRFGLTALTNVYRDRMVESLEAANSARRVMSTRWGVDSSHWRLSRSDATPRVQRRRDAAIERPDAVVDGVLTYLEAPTATHQVELLLAPG